MPQNPLFPISIEFSEQFNHWLVKISDFLIILFKKSFALRIYTPKKTILADPFDYVHGRAPTDYILVDNFFEFWWERDSPWFKFHDRIFCTTRSIQCNHTKSSTVASLVPERLKTPRKSLPTWPVSVLRLRNPRRVKSRRYCFASKMAINPLTHTPHTCKKRLKVVWYCPMTNGSNQRHRIPF